MTKYDEGMLEERHLNMSVVIVQKHSGKVRKRRCWKVKENFGFMI